MRSPRVRPSCRPRLSVESLEDRLAPATFTVTNSNDAGTGSLRWAITRANNIIGADAVAFNIPGSGIHTVDLASALPAVTDRLTIDGTTQPGTPLIELNGAGAGAGVDGLSITPGGSGSVVKGLVINRFAGNGINITGSNCVVTKCLIGTDPAGALASPNGKNGVRIFAGSNNVIQRNVISGNVKAGLVISTRAGNNVVRGNLIGVDATSTVALPNDDGVRIWWGATNNTVGGTAPAARNVISGNSNEGVLIDRPDTTGNKVLGNYIGTNGTGDAAVGNGDAGVHISVGASNNVVGGTIAGARNVISGNALVGLRIFGVAFGPITTTGNKIQGNYIGTDATGTKDLGNAFEGVYIVGGGVSGNVLGGVVAGAGNVISGNGRYGVEVVSAGTMGNVVRGNLIGTDATGTLDLGNSSHGVLISGASSGTTVVGNVISGNDGDGVEIDFFGLSPGSKVQGNYIGTDVTGTLALGNADDGVQISGGASGNTIGGTTPGERNVISGNGSNGVRIVLGVTTGNQVQGNYIGTDKTGTFDLGNASNGVLIDDGATNNAIGGVVAGARNVISGNGGDGVRISGAPGNQVQGNYIGTDKAGAAALANSLMGVSLEAGASNNFVGGPVAGAGNVISGNTGSGVLVAGPGTTSNRVQGNRIGLAAASAAALGNGMFGVFVTDQAAGNRIGGTAAGTGNVIANSGGAGVLVGSDPISSPAAAGVGNAIRGNRIFANGGLGIDLGPNDGVTANDLDDPDSGPNNLLNFPELTAAKLTAAGLRISGWFNTEPGKILRIEFFASPSADPSGNGEGQRYLGFVIVAGGIGKLVTFSTFLDVSGVLPGQFVTATATDDDGNTSEFSKALAVT